MLTGSAGPTGDSEDGRANTVGPGVRLPAGEDGTTETAASLGNLLCIEGICHSKLHHFERVVPENAQR